MQCTVCHYPHTSVVKTTQEDDDSIKRRRECIKCGMRFTTKEALKEPRKLKKTDYK